MANKAFPTVPSKSPAMPMPMHTAGMPKHKPGMLMDTAPMKTKGFQKINGSHQSK